MNERTGEANSADREIVITRLIAAPQELVFDAWTDPKRIVQWWGPRGFTTTTKSMDVRPGGVWRFVMHGPDGRDYDNLVTYLEVSRPKRIVYRHGGVGDTENIKFLAAITFRPVGDKTEVTLRSVFATAEERDHVVKEHGAIEGGEQTLARLDEHVSGLAGGGGGSAASSGSEFVISRLFDAPRDLVWRAHSDLDAVKQWWGPKGFSWMTGTLDFRPGGFLHYGLRSPTGQEMWGKISYREIVKPERIVSVLSFSDAKGGIARHPLSADWPEQMLNVATFSEANGKTTLTIRSKPLDATASEIQVFCEGFKSMDAGFNGTFDQLAAYLARIA